MLFLPAKCNDIIHVVALLAQLATPLCELYMHGFVQVLQTRGQHHSQIRTHTMFLMT